MHVHTTKVEPRGFRYHVSWAQSGSPYSAPTRDVVHFNFLVSDSTLPSEYHVVENSVVAPQGLHVALDPKPAYLCACFYPIQADNLLDAAFIFAVWKARRRFEPICSQLPLRTEVGADGRSLVRRYPNKGH
jgi:hypothetical protein